MNKDPQAIEALAAENRRFTPSPEFVAHANISTSALYDEATNDHEGFWSRQARELVSWHTPWDRTLQWNLPFAKWFVGGRLNSC